MENKRMLKKRYLVEGDEAISASQKSRLKKFVTTDQSNQTMIEEKDDRANDDDGCPTKIDGKSSFATEGEIAESQAKRSEADSAFIEKDYERAIQLYTEAILLNPHATLLYAKRGQVYLLLNKPNACLRDCDRAILLNPYSAAGYKYRERANRLLGQFEEAPNDLKLAYKFDFDEEAEDWLEEITPNQCKENFNMNFALCSSPKHTSPEMENNESLAKNNTNILNAFKDIVNVQHIAKESDVFDKSFYFPELNINKNDHVKDDAENEPPEKRKPKKVAKLQKRKENVLKQINSSISFRCKTYRAKLKGWDCWECEKYYKALGLSKDELQKRINRCSRHRYKYKRPHTPEGFWNPEFPDSDSEFFGTS